MLNLIYFYQKVRLINIRWILLFLLYYFQYVVFTTILSIKLALKANKHTILIFLSLRVKRLIGFTCYAFKAAGLLRHSQTKYLI